MQTTKHTPGPWLLTAGRMLETSSGRFYLSYHTEQRTGRAEFQNFTELDANARLIAVAPEMLEALQQAAKLIETARPRFPKSVKHPDRFQLESACAAINNALHKATKA